jgi:hypothetical protein
MENILRDFSKWTLWKQREELDLSRPGVYILGRFEDGASGKPQMSLPLVYIGETCGQSLRSRLGQFERSAFFGKAGHSGGLTFASTYQPAPDPSWLYISVLGVFLEEPQSSAYIRYVERALLWQYVQNHQGLPACNRK